MTDDPPRRSGIRTLKVTVPSLFLVLKALSDTSIRAAGADLLPASCAVAGEPRWDQDTQTLEIDVFAHDWQIAGDDIELLWARQLTPHTWGPGTALDLAPAPTRR